MNVNHLENALSEFVEPSSQPCSRRFLLSFPESQNPRSISPQRVLFGLHQRGSASFPLNAISFSTLELLSLPHVGRNPGLPWGPLVCFPSLESPALPALQCLKQLPHIFCPVFFIIVAWGASILVTIVLPSPKAGVLFAFLLCFLHYILFFPLLTVAWLNKFISFLVVFFFVRGDW